MKDKVFIIFLLFLFACATPLEEGIIVNKSFHPAHVKLMPMYHRIGKMTTVTYIHRFVPDMYSIDIEGYVEGEKTQRAVYVNKKEYDNLHLGEYYKVKKNNDE